MAIEGELNPGETVIECTDCNDLMVIGPCQSAAGYYIGFWCKNCGPYSRESGYYKTHNEANEALITNNVNWRSY